MRLGIDLDGVVVNWHKAVIDQLNKQFNLALPPNAIKHWNFLDITPFKEWSQFWKWCDEYVDFEHLDAVKDAKDVLNFQHHIRNHEIIIITSRPKWGWGGTLRWLDANDIPYSEVHFTNKKSMVKCDLYIDDAPAVLQELYLATWGNVVRFERPWNASLDEVTWDYSVRNWAEITDLLMSNELNERV